MNLLTASSVPDTSFSELKYLNAQDDNTAQRGCKINPVHLSVRPLKKLNVLCYLCAQTSSFCIAYILR